MISPGSTRVLDWDTGEAGRLHARALPLCHRRREPRAFRSVRRLVGRDQRQLRPEGDRGRLRLPVVHEPGGAIERRRHLGWTGYNPYRISQFENVDPWVEAGFSPEFAENYLGAIGASLNSPNMASDLRIPGHPALRGRRARPRDGALPGRRDLGRTGARRTSTTGWEEITEEFGRDDQLKLYKASLGITN